MEFYFLPETWYSINKLSRFIKCIGHIYHISTFNGHEVFVFKCSDLLNLFISDTVHV